MIDTRITMEAARAVGRIADKHAEEDACIRIQWREVDDERTWIVSVEHPGGGSDPVYIVDDETGTHAPLNQAERDRLILGEPIFPDSDYADA